MGIRLLLPINRDRNDVGIKPAPLLGGVGGGLMFTGSPPGIGRGWVNLKKV